MTTTFNENFISSFVSNFLPENNILNGKFNSYVGTDLIENLSHALLTGYIIYNASAETNISYIELAVSYRDFVESSTATLIVPSGSSSSQCSLESIDVYREDDIHSAIILRCVIDLGRSR